jgi:DNA mismatch repair protein MutS2
VEAEVEEIEEKVEEPVERRPSTIDHRPSGIDRPPSLGERVTVSTLNAEGVVTALGESDAEVQVGSLRIRAKLSDLERKRTTDNKSPEEKKQQPVETSTVRRPSTTVQSPGIELDIRGQISEDALDMLDRYIERAYAAGLPFVRIIHGKGTGKLRQVVRDALRGSSHVTSFEEGKPNEGGAGVTVAKIG